MPPSVKELEETCQRPTILIKCGKDQQSAGRMKLADNFLYP
jgi:hypothetical protein